MFNPFSAESYRFHPKPPEGSPKPEPTPFSVEQTQSVTPIEPAPPAATPPSIEAVSQSPQAVEVVSMPDVSSLSPEPNDLHSDASKLMQEKQDQQVQDNPGAG